jgi:hypothetical protein
MSAYWKALFLITAAIALGAGNAQAQCALPYTLSNGQLPDATKVMANFNALISCFSVGGSTNAIQYNGGSGALAGAGPLTNGQVLIGSSGNPPQAGTLTAGTGITIANGPGTVTISAPSQASTGLYRQVMSALPTAATTGLANWLNQGSATYSEGPVGLSITSAPTNTVIARSTPAPAPPYTVRALIASTINGAGSVGIGFYDGLSKLHVLSFGPTATSGGISLFQILKWSTPTAFFGGDFVSNNINYSQPIWLQLQDDGTNVSFGFGQDGANFVNIFSVAKSTGYLGASGYGNLVFFVNSGGAFSTIGTLMSWTIN